MSKNVQNQAGHDDPPPDAPLGERAVAALVERLQLSPHPEGGWYRETWRSPVTLARDVLPGDYSGDRAAMTSILYLLPTGGRSRAHRVLSEELWMHHQGDDLQLRVGPELVDNAPSPATIRLGQGPTATLQAVVPPRHWQDAVALPGPWGYVLVGCVVAPGFDFDDFEMIDA